MTPLLAALSSSREAVVMACTAVSRSPASAASRNLRTDVLSEDLTPLLRRRAFSFVLIRLSWDLMFATKKPFVLVGRIVASARGGADRLDRLATPAPWREPSEGVRPAPASRTGESLGQHVTPFEPRLDGVGAVRLPPADGGQTR